MRRLGLLIRLRKLYRNLLRADGLLAQDSPIYRAPPPLPGALRGGPFCTFRDTSCRVHGAQRAVVHAAFSTADLLSYLRVRHRVLEPASVM